MKAKTAAELLDDGARAWQEEFGEAGNAYTLLCAGIAHAVTTQTDVLTDYREISNEFHNPLASMPEGSSVAQICIAVQHPMGGYRRPRAEFRSTSSFRSVSARAVKLGWIEEEVKAALRSRKIRRGTKRFAEWVQEAKPKVLAAATKEAHAAIERFSKDTERDLEKAREESGRLVATAERHARHVLLKQAILTALDCEADPAVVEADEEFERSLGAALRQADGHINYLYRQASEVDAEALAHEALQASSELKDYAPVTDMRTNAASYYVWVLSSSGVPLSTEGPYGPFSFSVATQNARIASSKGMHDRAVTRGSDPSSKSFVVARRYQAGTGAEVL